MGWVFSHPTAYFSFMRRCVEMKFYFICPGCKKNLRADTADIGSKGTCSICGEKMLIPDPDGGKREQMALVQAAPQVTQPTPPQQYVSMQSEPLMGSIAAIAASNVRDILKSSLDHIDQHTLRKNIHNYETSDLAYLSNQFLAAQFGLTEAQRQNMLPFPPRGNTLTVVNTQQSGSPQQQPQTQPDTPSGGGGGNGGVGSVVPDPAAQSGGAGSGGAANSGVGGESGGAVASPTGASGADSAAPVKPTWMSRLLPWLVAGTMGAGATGAGAVLNHYLEKPAATDGIPAGVGWEAES